MISEKLNHVEMRSVLIYADDVLSLMEIHLLF